MKRRPLRAAEAAARNLALALMLAGSLVPAAFAQPAAGEGEGAKVAPADLELLERILEESGVETRPDRAGITSYAGHLMRSLQAWAAETLAAALGRVEHLDEAIVWVGGLLVLVAAVLVIVALALLLARWLRNRSPQEAAARAAPPAAAAVHELAAGDWRSRIDGRLESGDVAGALEAVWWWLARSLAGAGADPSWTGRELVERCRRPELRPLTRRLDALVYGASAPPEAAVRHLVLELEGKLA